MWGLTEEDTDAIYEELFQSGKVDHRVEVFGTVPLRNHIFKMSKRVQYADRESRTVLIRQNCSMTVVDDLAESPDAIDLTNWDVLRK
jgi:hypothetical protein